jgi:putative nucleotide binding protein
LTSTAKSELLPVIEGLVEKKKKAFLNIFNLSQPLTPRMHSLELLPGIGKKYMLAILRQREIKLFSSFDDLKQRTDVPDPVKLITKRILEELIEDPKYRLFTRPSYLES